MWLVTPSDRILSPFGRAVIMFRVMEGYERINFHKPRIPTGLQAAICDFEASAL
jgi:hypothetical protein